jgi:hypothetical protein
MMPKLAFLLGLFAVPIGLLVAGHGFRRRSARRRAIFWGATVGFLAGALLTVTLSLLPSTPWPDASPRAFLVHWSSLLGALLGAGASALKAQRGSS